MPLGDFEKSILRLLAGNRNPESYIAGATVFLRRDDSLRQSQDIDVFHDTVQSLQQAATQDAVALEQNGYALQWLEKQEMLRRAVVSRGGQATKMEWCCDSAFRFFPVQADSELGFVLHPLDGATNKLLALAGRGELRDYLDAKGRAVTPNPSVPEFSRLQRHYGSVRGAWPTIAGLQD